MTSISEIVRLSNMYSLPEEVLEHILKYVYSWGHPKVDIQGYVVSKVKNTHKCPVDLVLENVVNRPRWQHIARVPALHAYERRVCIWSPDYYDIKTRIVGISNWSDRRQRARPMIRKSDEWIGFRSWVQTHPAFSRYAGLSPGAPLSKHWFKYELALAYPTLYGKNGWTKKIPKAN